MDFKKNVYLWDKERLRRLYASINSVSRNRPTDLAPSHLKLILDLDLTKYKTLIDVGCGKGFLLERIKVKFPHLEVRGCDVVNALRDPTIMFTEADLAQLPFPDKYFDVVISCHTIEHIPELQRAVDELKRIANGKLIIVTPRQRYFYYTLDEHVNFFPFQEKLTHLLGLPRYDCRLLDGDWMYIGEIS
jgi:ubiquinone/menaquinone biosynthesis C-methylase UbiE